MQAKSEIILGHPPKKYLWTGRWEKTVLGGGRGARRNRKISFLPIYDPPMAILLLMRRKRSRKFDCLGYRFCLTLGQMRARIRLTK